MEVEQQKKLTKTGRLKTIFLPFKNIICVFCSLTLVGGSEDSVG